MGKKDVISDGLIQDEEKEEVEVKEVKKSTTVQYTLEQYFENFMSGKVDKYEKAYLVARYQGQLRSEIEWSQELEKIFK